MAKKNSQCETDFILRIYRGVTVSLPFTYQEENGDPVILTGATITFLLKFGSTTLTYTSVANSFGSKTEVTDDLNGEFLALVTDEETTQLDADFTTGTWAVLLNDSLGNIDLLWKGTVTVEDL